MAGETIQTIVGNLTADPELRYTQAGLAVANFTVASTPRQMNRQTQQWEDGTPLFMRCTVWREFAEHVSQSLTKGSRVIVQGRLEQRNFEDQQGQRRTTIELQVDAIGPDLKYATAAVTRITRDGTQPPPQRQQQAPPQGQQQGTQYGADPWGAAPAGGQQQAQADPWAQAPAGADSRWTQGEYSDETPF